MRTLTTLATAMALAAGLWSCSGDKSGDSTPSATTQQKVINPITEANCATKATDPMPDGGYHVAFDASAMDSDGYVDVEFFNYDMYNPSDIDSLATGDIIVIANNKVAVQTLERRTTGDGRRYVNINGDIEEGGHILKLEDDGLYRTMVMDDYPDYYSIGTSRIRIQPDVVFTDDSDMEQRIEATGRAAVASTDVPQYYQTNTTAVIKNNHITHINRIWVP